MKFVLISTAVIMMSILVVALLTGNSKNPVGVDGGANVELITREVEAGEATLLDVRTQVEYDVEHADIAQNHNVEKMKVGDLPDTPKDHRLYLYCNSGNRTGTATEILEAAGYTDIVDLGAFTNWTDFGGETLQTQLADYTQLLSDLGEEPIESLGPDDAELTIVKYTDFQCPYCARYTVETEPQILENFVNVEDSKVRYEIRNAAFLGDESALAAIGGYCANEQGLYWQYHNELTRVYSLSGPEVFTYDSLVSVIGVAGGDSDSFLSCLRSDKYDSVVSSETISASNEGINSTPAFKIGDQVVNGALPYSSFEAAINAQL